jgi:Multiubiquitin
MSDKDAGGKTTQGVRIHIDRERYESVNPTTGAALYLLGKIEPLHELFREENGNHEDEIVPNNDSKIHLIQDEHFYSEAVFFIIVNGQNKMVTKKLLAYDELVALAFTPQPDFQYTITYRRGPHSNREGSLVEGKTIKIKNGMIFNVTATNKS